MKVFILPVPGGYLPNKSFEIKDHIKLGGDFVTEWFTARDQAMRLWD